jgi:hypothetical protein
MNAKDPEEIKTKTHRMDKAVDVVQDIIDDAIDIEEVVKKPRRQNKRRKAKDTTVPVIEAIEKSLYKTQSPNQPKKSSPAFPKNQRRRTRSDIYRAQYATEIVSRSVT